MAYFSVRSTNGSLTAGATRKMKPPIRAIGDYGAACYDWGLGDSYGSSTYTITQITRSLIHSNWGWGTASNAGDAAWFAPGVFGREGSNFERAKYIVPFFR